jgi:hypothetical protein
MTGYESDKTGSSGIAGDVVGRRPDLLPALPGHLAARTATTSISIGTGDRSSHIVERISRESVLRWRIERHHLGTAQAADAVSAARAICGAGERQT